MQYCSNPFCYDVATEGTSCTSHKSQQSYTSVLEVPATNYWLSIREVREGKDAIYLLSRVGCNGFGGMAISMLTQTVQGFSPSSQKPTKQLLLGKTWTWGDDEIVSLQNEAELPEDFESGKILYFNTQPANPESM